MGRLENIFFLIACQRNFRLCKPQVEMPPLIETCVNN